MAFTVFPAVDLRSGRCVQLVGGDPAKVRVSLDDGLGAAREWVEQGARALHIVDLDGALDGRRVNAPIVERIVSELDVFTQVGGGIRDRRTALDLLDLGVDRVILGTAAVQNPNLVEDLAREVGPQRVMVSIDTAHGEVVTRGWTEGSGRGPLWWGQRFQRLGAGSLLFTDVDREGRLEQVDTTTLSRLVRASGVPVVFAGGITTLSDVKVVKACVAAGVVIGSAIYAKKISLPDALAFQEG